MAFDPREFLQLGLTLQTGTTEAEYRTAIGRLYYAVHLKARESLLAKGWAMPRMNVHSAVIDELDKRGHHQVAPIRALKRLRIKSDYRLSTQVSEKEARRAKSIALRVWPHL